jgi:hypothetical protein
VLNSLVYANGRYGISTIRIWYNGSRLLEPLGYVPPAEFERAYYACQTAPAELVALT